MSASRRSGRVVDIARPPLLEDAAFCAELDALAGKLDLSPELARKQAGRCIDELAIRPRDRYLNWSARLARFMYSRSYDPDLDVDRQALAHLQSLARERPLVFLWSHKSHLDSFVFMRAIYDGGFRPQPLSFAGINMAFAGFATLARNAGAIFLRRSFRGADIYKLVFRHYVRYLVAQRAPLSWSIEGTRSRTGKLMPPKPGLMQWVLEALEANDDKSALFVPVSITFDQIAEMDDYIAINRGEPKRRESLGWFLGYIFGMQSQVGRIHVRFGEPLSLQEPGEAPAALLGTSADPQQARTLKLALEVSRRIEHNTLVTPQSLVCLALLAIEGESTGLAQLQAALHWLQKDVARAGLPREQALDEALTVGLAQVLESLAGSGIVRAGGSDHWSINPDKALGASYYRNTVSHYFLYAALGELALAQAATEGPCSRTDIGDAVLEWRRWLRFEYVFVDRQGSVEQALGHLDRVFPDWERQLAGGQSPFSARQPIYARGILVSVLEAYRLFAVSLLAPEATDGGDSRPQRALEHALASAGPLQSAVSLPLMVNAERLFSSEGLIRAQSPALDECHTALARALDALRAVAD